VFVEEGLQVKSFRDMYFESKYSKNAVGAMVRSRCPVPVNFFFFFLFPTDADFCDQKELAWQASHGPGDVGLDTTILADITWSLWKALTAAIRECTKSDLTADELHALAKEICKCQRVRTLSFLAVARWV
jgi:hypothetical protein